MRNPELALLGLRLSVVALIAFCGRALVPQPAAADDPPVTDQPSTSESAARKKQREDNLQAMAERAGRGRIRLAGNTGKEDEMTDCRLIPQPLFHYTDQPRRITDATLWGWTSGERLVAICKIERYDHENPVNQWLYCVGSLAPGRIETEWPSRHVWSAKKPGVDLTRMTSAPSPADGRPARLRQMKEIAGRFTATLSDATGADRRQEMRLLPRPLYRYEIPAGDVLDGAVFGFTTNGTNPDAILVVELDAAPVTGAPQWKFGLAGMTTGGLSVKFDGDDVWSKPSVTGTAASFDTWTFFWHDPK